METISPNIVIVKHGNIFNSNFILYDKKHLNTKGVRLFAKNLKGAFFNKKRRQSQRHPRRMHSDFNNPTFPRVTQQQDKPNSFNYNRFHQISHHFLPKTNSINHLINYLIKRLTSLIQMDGSMLYQGHLSTLLKTPPLCSHIHSDKQDPLTSRIRPVLPLKQ